MFDLFRKPVHHLLFFAGADTDIALKSKVLLVEIVRDFKGLIEAFVVIHGTQAGFSDVLFDWDGAAHALYEAEPGAIVLIRPDGYIGFRGGARHVEELREHLARIFSGYEFTQATIPGYLYASIAECRRFCLPGKFK